MPEIPFKSCTIGMLEIPFKSHNSDIKYHGIRETDKFKIQVYITFLKLDEALGRDISGILGSL
jgi:hypothetical protein